MVVEVLTSRPSGTHTTQEARSSKKQTPLWCYNWDGRGHTSKHKFVE